MKPVSPRAFERLVGDALDALPEELGRLMENVAIVARDRHPTEDLLGLYEGIPLTERDDYGGLVMPDVISLYRLPLCEMCADEEELVEEKMDERDFFCRMKVRDAIADAKEEKERLVLENEGKDEDEANPENCLAADLRGLIARKCCKERCSDEDAPNVDERRSHH